LKDCDKEIGKHSRQIILIVNNAGSYPHLMDLKNITLVFLPPNTTSPFKHSIWGLLKI
jgi:hypothetical protein